MQIEILSVDVDPLIPRLVVHVKPDPVMALFKSNSEAYLERASELFLNVTSMSESLALGAMRHKDAHVLVSHADDRTCDAWHIVSP